ncbi:MAG TPA: hypothetical protein VMZ52_07280 [Bryobacteraceae bacterium]|nr:hypothetical protein [Bryobacteraceae bacterium]
MKTLLHVKTSTSRAGCWFLQSGIQEETGGVARYFQVDKGRNARISTEITGYAVSALLYFRERLGEPSYLDAADRAGRFLIRDAWDTELQSFPFEHAADLRQRYTYFFDCGIIVRGLVHLWRATGDTDFLTIARSAGLSMQHDFASEELFHPILTLPEKHPVDRTSQWSRQPGCYQLKSAMAWRDLFDATGEQQFLDWYEAALQQSIAVKDIFLPAMEGPEKTMDRLHAYAYFLEGVLPAADRTECRRVLAEGIQRVSGYLREIAPIFVRSDVYAQLLRLRLFAAQLAGIPLNTNDAAEEAANIESFQYTGAEQRLAGGYCFGQRQGALLPFANPVSTAFCAQALDLWAQYRSGQPIDRQILI